MSYSEQFSRSSSVTLKSDTSSPSTIAFDNTRQSNLQETLHKLTIDGNGLVDFGDWYNHGIHKFILDDLEITKGSRLTIQNWQSGRDFLLVRKDSEHLQDALDKISFAGGIDQVELVDYNDEYYSISNTPEPEVYGSGLTAVALGALTFRRKNRSKPAA